MSSTARRVGRGIPAWPRPGPHRGIGRRLAHLRADQNANTSFENTGQELERQTVDGLRDLFGLSTAHSGTLVTGATMSNTVGLAIAREWIGEQRGVSVADDGVAALGPVRVLSGAAHSSIAKAMSVLGLGRASFEPGLLPVMVRGSSTNGAGPRDGIAFGRRHA